MHYPAKLWTEFSAGEIRHLWHWRLRQDSGNRLASLSNMNLTDFNGLSDPFTGIVVQLPDAYGFHVTQCVT
jgi:uncharacterized protein YjiS (DUF1127 family)